MNPMLLKLNNQFWEQWNSGFYNCKPGKVHVTKYENMNSDLKCYSLFLQKGR